MNEREQLLWGAFILLAGFVLKDVFGTIVRIRFRRASEAERDVFAEVIKRIDENQRELAALVHDMRRESVESAKELMKLLQALNNRVLRLETLHQRNHPDDRL